MEYPFKDLLPLDEVLAREGYYKDWTHLDPEVFYSLTQISEYIKTKGYGVDVRLLIAQLAEHFGLKTTQVVDLANLLQQKFTNLEGVTQSFTNNINSLVAQMEADKDAVIANATVDSEVILARGGMPTLQARLDDTTAQIERTENDLASRSVSVKNPPDPLVAALGDGVTDDTDAIQNIINYASGIGLPVYVPTGTYKLNGTLTINRSSTKLIGESRKTVFDFTGQADTGQTALTVSECLYVDISGIRFNGDRAINGLALLGSVEAGVVDSVFRDCLFSGFDIGLVTNRAWNNLFEGTRFRDSGILAMFGTETNSTLFNKCSFTGSDLWHMTFESNAGLTFNTCNFENMNGAGIRVGNSANVTFINPYFEIAANKVLELGIDFNNENETNYMSHVYMYGAQFANNDFKIGIGSGLVNLKIEGRLLGTLDILNRYDWQTRMAGGKIDLSLNGDNIARPEILYSGGGHGHLSHGDSKTVALQTSPASGGTVLKNGNIRMSRGLISGETYLVKLKAKKLAGFTKLTLSDASRAFDISHLFDYEFKEITIPIKADATLDRLNLNAQGSVMIDYVILSKGSNSAYMTDNTVGDLREANPPTVGTWTIGQIINNSAPSKGSQRGWVCVESGSPGVWEGLGII